MPFSTDTLARPAPFVPADTDVSLFAGFVLNVDHLLASELLAIGTPEQCWAALMLWCRAWKQIPAGSLPNDERVLASFSGAGRRWPKVRDVALHGFVLCSDGRLYHRFLCQVVLRAHAQHVAFQNRRETDRRRLSEWRAKQRSNGVETPAETVTETRFVAEERREEKSKKDTSPPTPEPNGSVVVAPLQNGETRFTEGGDKVRPPLRGSRLHQEICLSEDWFEAAAHGRLRAGLPPIDLGFEFEKFKNYWLSKAGKDATKVSWKRTWVNWALNAAPPRNGGGSPLLNLYEGAMRAADAWDERKRQESGNHGEGGGPAHPLLGGE